jgi:hypothetical protein
MANIPYAFVQRQMEEGRSKPSYLSNIFKEAGHPAPGSEDELVAKWTAASLYSGGADTVRFPDLLILTLAKHFLDCVCDGMLLPRNDLTPRSATQSAR